MGGAYHADGLAGPHVVVVGVPPLELGVLSVLQDVLLALEVGVVEADPGSALHTDGVHPENTQRTFRARTCVYNVLFHTRRYTFEDPSLMIEPL